MKRFEGFHKGGRFRLAGDAQFVGELTLDGWNSRLTLHGEEFFNTRACTDIFGTFHDRQKVSLLNCITRESGSGGGRDDGFFYASVFPHTVLLGERHVSSTDRAIREVAFSFDDAAVIFHDYEAFGEISGDRARLETILEQQGMRPTEGLGDYPLVFFFTGKYEIVSVKTEIGIVAARHHIGYAMPGPDGIAVKNTIRLCVEFENEHTVDETMIIVYDLLRFLSVLAGRPQTLRDLSFGLESTSDDHPGVWLDACHCTVEQRSAGEGVGRLHPVDVPVPGARNIDEFKAVMSAWIKRNPSWRAARARYAAAAAHQHTYGIDRIVGAANMFDILPGSAVAANVEVPMDLAGARDAARTLFKKLPNTPERNSVLSALARVGAPTLRSRVLSRARIVSAKCPDLFPELELVVKHAIDCRNFFVHGSPGEFDFTAHDEVVAFLTQALEFIFAASDLIECGWDVDRWKAESGTMSHPFREFRVNYHLRLGVLKAVLASLTEGMQRS